MNLCWMQLQVLPLTFPLAFPLAAGPAEQQFATPVVIDSHTAFALLALLAPSDQCPFGYPLPWAPPTLPVGIQIV